MTARFDDIFPLPQACIHEVYGPAAAAFAALAAHGRPPVLWIHEARKCEALNPLGLKPFLDPAHLLIAQTQDQKSSLAVAEEALRDGAVPFAVIEVTRPLNLREGRRLQLAAKSGGTTGLCIIGEGMGSNAADTRWAVAPVFDPAQKDSTLMHWAIKKNKKGTFGAWNVRWDQKTHRVHVVSPAGE